MKKIMNVSVINYLLLVFVSHQSAPVVVELNEHMDRWSIRWYTWMDEGWLDDPNVGWWHVGWDLMIRYGSVN